MKQLQNSSEFERDKKAGKSAEKERNLRMSIEGKFIIRNYRPKRQMSHQNRTLVQNHYQNEKASLYEEETSLKGKLVRPRFLRLQRE